MESHPEVDHAAKTMVESIVERLTVALDEKREIEVERLQLQKNYLRAKNEAKHLREQLYAAQKDEPTLTKENQVKL